MNKLDMNSKNLISENIQKIGKLFPNCIIENKIDFNLLKQELSDELIENSKERYQISWPGKGKAIAKANEITSNTLCPMIEKSVDFDNTHNIYIEGDNLETLKILQESYLNKIKCIYIDPPYNTGNDFIYKDKFKKNNKDELIDEGQTDAEGNILSTNLETDGAFHSNWMSMIYPRIKLARNLLTNDGLIFISIGDDEQANLKKICDEIFGTKNFISCICHKARASVSNDRIISENHNYILLYCKNIDVVFQKHKLIGEDPDLTGFNYEDEKGKYKLTPVDGPGGAKKGNPYYDFMGVEGYWRYSKETMTEKYNQGLIVRTPNGLQQKYYLEQAQQSRKTVTTWWDEDFLTSSATKKLSDLMGGKYFDNPKNLNLLMRILKMCTYFDKDALILDFFSGSATTAHAVMQLNSEDNGHRKYIMVQIPEICNEKSDAYKNGFKTICDVGQARIKKAAENIKKETNANIDYGFRVYQVASSNMKDVYYEPSKLNQTQLNMFESNIKEDRTAEDLLTQVILDLGLTLDLNIEEKNILDNKVFFVAGNSLVACFDDKINIDIINQICDVKPLKIVFRESSFINDSAKINAYERIKKLSPETEISVI